MTTMNITCWVSYVDYKKKYIHMAFDLNDNDYEKLLNATKDMIRKRLNQKGFIIQGDAEICKELDQLVGKKLVINIKLEHYIFDPIKNFRRRELVGGYRNRHSQAKYYRDVGESDRDNYIEGYIFRYNGLRCINDEKVDM